MSGPLNERRRFGRREAFKLADILLSDAANARCTIVNISEGGALLALPEDADLPVRFDLHVHDDDMVVHCRVAHRSPGKVGVEFVSLPRRAARYFADRSRIRGRVLKRVFGDDQPACQADAEEDRPAAQPSSS